MTPATKKAAPTAQGRQAPPAAAGGELASLPMAELERRFDSSADGLSQAEAHERLEKYGYNELPEAHVNPLLKFLSYFWGPIPWMIEAAAILSALVRHWADFVIILVLLLANAVVGFWEEYQAGNAIAALKAKLALQRAREARRQVDDVPARELVPGDLIRLRLGDIVPADARLLEGDPVEVDQSALTGESLPVDAQGRARRSIPARSFAQGEIDALVYGHRREHLLRQDRATGRDGHDRQPFPARRAEDRRLPDRDRRGAGGR